MDGDNGRIATSANEKAERCQREDRFRSEQWGQNYEE
jgi:hypothetical protein